MYYVYRFLDVDDNILYIGKTNNLESRIYQHFNNGHLEEQCYNNVDKVEYLDFKNESDQHISEIYLINKYKPIYNKRDKKDDTLNLELNINENWIYYNANFNNQDNYTIREVLLSLPKGSLVVLSDRVKSSLYEVVYEYGLGKGLLFAYHDVEGIEYNNHILGTVGFTCFDMVWDGLKLEVLKSS